MSGRAAIYCRISDDREGAGLGVARQEKDCRDLAHTLHAEVVEVYTDNDISAFDRRKQRPAYLRLLEDVRVGRVSVVLAWHTDRLHRSPRELEDWIDACEQGGVTVHTVKAGPLDLATPSGRMTARMLGSAARYESEQKRDRNLRKARELADAGKLGNGGPRPFGYEADRLTLHPEEAAVLRGCYADVLAGKALTSIVRDLHVRGITTSTGGPWSIQGLKFTLLRARNMGWREHRGRLAARAAWEPIVDEDTWQQARAVLTDPARLNAGRAQYVRRYLLTGYLLCGRCGRALRPVKSTRGEVQRFACRALPGQPKCDGGCSIVYPPVEELVERLLLDWLDGIRLDPAPVEDPNEAIRERIAQLEARLAALGDAFGDDGGDVLEFRRAGQRIRERIADLRRDLTHAQRQADPVQVRRDWPGYDLEQRREVVAQVIDSITVAPARRGLNRFDPDRLTINWR